MVLPKTVGLVPLVQLRELVSHLDEYLKVNQIRDSSLNGLQVEGPAEVTKVALAVDGSMEAFRHAAQVGAQLLVVHHGIIWSKSAIVGTLYQKIAYLITQNLGLYAAHLPLDTHPEVGNNAQLAAILKLDPEVEQFGEHYGSLIGIMGKRPSLRFTQLVDELESSLHAKVQWFAFGPDVVSHIAICSGAAGRYINEAIAREAECFVTGEASHEAYVAAKDGHINVIFAGHYASETLGVKALGRHLETRFGLETSFIELPTRI